jgi:hypothetical protein
MSARLITGQELPSLPATRYCWRTCMVRCACSRPKKVSVRGMIFLLAHFRGPRTYVGTVDNAATCERALAHCAVRALCRDRRAVFLCEPVPWKSAGDRARAGPAGRESRQERRGEKCARASDARRRESCRGGKHVGGWGPRLRADEEVAERSQRIAALALAGGGIGINLGWPRARGERKVWNNRCCTR